VPVIYLIRHAQASFGEQDYDVLSEIGHEQAARIGADLALRGVRAVHVVAGDLRRQLDTARACTASVPGEPVVDARWNEYDSAGVLAHHGPTDGDGTVPDGIGAPSGLSSREFQGLLDPALRAWIAAGASSACAESWPAFSGRVRAALDDLAAGLGSGETGLAFTSGGVIAAIATALLDVPAETFVALNRIAVNTGLSKVLSGRSGLQLLSYNEQGHVDADRRLMTFR
jgi:broad specificity phosphatase PhoE